MLWLRRVAVDVVRGRTSRALSSVPGMNAWPPKPGLTDMRRMMSTLSITYLRDARSATAALSRACRARRAEHGATLRAVGGGAALELRVDGSVRMQSAGVQSRGVQSRGVSSAGVLGIRHGEKNAGKQGGRHALQAVERRRRVEDEAGLTASRTDERERTVDVARRLCARTRHRGAAASVRTVVMWLARVARGASGAGVARTPAVAPVGPGGGAKTRAPGWKVMKSAPASAKSPMIASTGDTIRWTSMGALMP